MGTRTYSRRAADGTRVLTALGRARAGIANQDVDIFGEPIDTPTGNQTVAEAEQQSLKATLDGIQTNAQQVFEYMGLNTNVPTYVGTPNDVVDTYNSPTYEGRRVVASIMETLKNIGKSAERDGGFETTLVSAPMQERIYKEMYNTALQVADAVRRLAVIDRDLANGDEDFDYYGAINGVVRRLDPVTRGLSRVYSDLRDEVADSDWDNADATTRGRANRVYEGLQQALMLVSSYSRMLSDGRDSGFTEPDNWSMS